MDLKELKIYIVRAETEELEKEFGLVRAKLQKNEIAYSEGLLKLCLIEKELGKRETISG